MEETVSLFENNTTNNGPRAWKQHMKITKNSICILGQFNMYAFKFPTNVFNTDANSFK